MDKTVDNYLEKQPNWSRHLALLREIIKREGLDEHIKWGMPVYSYSGKNAVGFGATKNYVGIWFFQGGLLKDVHNKLMNAQEGKTQAMRQWRFTDLETIKSEKELIQSYIQETLVNIEKGITIAPRQKRPLIIPNMLQAALNNDKQLSHQFQKLSLSNRREYAEYILEAKKDETKNRRLEKIKSLILRGRGLNDKYK